MPTARRSIKDIRPLPMITPVERLMGDWGALRTDENFGATPSRRDNSSCCSQCSLHDISGTYKASQKLGTEKTPNRRTLTKGNIFLYKPKTVLSQCSLQPLTQSGTVSYVCYNVWPSHEASVHYSQRHAWPADHTHAAPYTERCTQRPHAERHVLELWNRFLVKTMQTFSTICGVIIENKQPQFV